MIIVETEIESEKYNIEHENTMRELYETEKLIRSDYETFEEFYESNTTPELEFREGCILINEVTGEVNAYLIKQNENLTTLTDVKNSTSLTLKENIKSIINKFQRV